MYQTHLNSDEFNLDLGLNLDLDLGLNLDLDLGLSLDLDLDLEHKDFDFSEGAERVV